MWSVRVLLTATLLMWMGNGGGTARADVALLMEEPYGFFGDLSPTGHAAVYLNHVCAESPTKLRSCQPGEPGVVISRYSGINGFDWIAIPLVPYLYAVERPEDVPVTADADLKMYLRDSYRRQHLLRLAPDASEAGLIPRGEWVELVGVSYDRKIYGFQLKSTQEEDEGLIARFNDRSNVSHFNFFFHNCADFARVLINGYYPHALNRNYIVDFGLTTPKQDARSLTKYAKRHPELGFSTFVIPQVPGSIHRSKPVKGIAEALIKSKKYVAVLFILSPQFTAGLVAVYLVDGRFQPPKTERLFSLPSESEELAQKNDITIRLVPKRYFLAPPLATTS